MVRWRSTGDVLRWWRSDVLHLTQQEAAERLNVRSSALSNWERGTRTISVDLAEIDDALKGEQVLEGLLWAYRTPEGLDPGRVWTKVFAGPSQPVWLWLRSPAAKLWFEGEWGVARMETELQLGPNGAFITVGASIADSPVVVHCSEPTWADFGYGELPGDVPGAPVVSAVSMFGRSSADGQFMQLFSSDIANKYSSGEPDVLDLADASPKAIVSYVHDQSLPAAEKPVPRRWPPSPEGIDGVDRERFAALRRARGLSRMTLADRLADLTGIDVSRDTLRRFETDVGRPHDPMLPVALDHALGAGGRLAVLEIRAGSGSDVVMLPSFWRGPIWIELENERGSGEVVFRRGNWHRELSFSGKTLVSAHWFEPSVPFRITTEGTTRWRLGVGRRAGAEPADQNWAPATINAAQEGLAETEQAIFTAVDRRPKPHPDDPIAEQDLSAEDEAGRPDEIDE